MRFLCKGADLQLIGSWSSGLTAGQRVEHRQVCVCVREVKKQKWKHTHTCTRINSQGVYNANLHGRCIAQISSQKCDSSILPTLVGFHCWLPSVHVRQGCRWEAALKIKTRKNKRQVRPVLRTKYLILWAYTCAKHTGRYVTMQCTAPEMWTSYTLSI